MASATLQSRKRSEEAIREQARDERRNSDKYIDFVNKNYAKYSASEKKKMRSKFADYAVDTGVDDLNQIHKGIKLQQKYGSALSDEKTKSLIKTASKVDRSDLSGKGEEVLQEQLTKKVYSGNDEGKVAEAKKQANQMIGYIKELKY